MGHLVLITGGARSGKSRFALQYTSSKQSEKKLFIATAVAFDDEMQERIQKHQLERGHDWDTIESPYELPQTIDNLVDGTTSVIDCITVWLGNIWFKYGNADEILLSHIDNLIRALSKWQKESSGNIVIVTNEVGWGIIPADSATRRYRDWAGKLNQLIGSIADEVFLCVAGIPVSIKSEGNYGKL